MARTLAWGARGRTFKSCYPDANFLSFLMMDNAVEKCKEKTDLWKFPEPEAMNLEDARSINNCLFHWLEQDLWLNKGIRAKYPKLESFLYTLFVCEDLVYENVFELSERLREMRSIDIALKGSNDINVIGNSIQNILNNLSADPIIYDKLSEELNNQKED